MSPAEQEALEALRAWDEEHHGLEMRALRPIGARLCLAMTRLSEEAPTLPSAPIPKRVSSGAMKAVREEDKGLAARVDKILKGGKEEP